MPDPKYAHEKHAARDRARVTPYDLPVPEYCAWPTAEGKRCGGNLHVVHKIRGEDVVDSRGNTSIATICEKCHNVIIYETGRNHVMAKGRTSSDAKKKARELADAVNKTGVLIGADGKPQRVTVDLEGKHWKVRAGNGAYIYSFSTTPSDIRSIRNCESQLKRMNVRWGSEAEDLLAAAPNGNGAKPKAPGMDANNLTETQKRAIDLRARLVTLKNMLGGTNKDLVHIGLEAAEKRKTWTYKTPGSAQVQIGRFLMGQGSFNDKFAARSLDFYEALCDELEGIPPEDFKKPRSQQRVPAPPPPSPAPPPVIVAPEPEPEPEPEPVPAPEPPRETSRQLANLTVALEDADHVIDALRERIANKEDELATARSHMSELRDSNHDLLGKLDSQRAETLGAQAEVRQLRARVADMAEELQEARASAARGGGSPDDPLYLKALRRLVAAAGSPDEIEEAFEMAKEIAKANL